MDKIDITQSIIKEHSANPEDFDSRKAAVKIDSLYAMKRCPYQLDLRIFCREKKCTHDCPIFAKQSGYLAMAINQ